MPFYVEVLPRVGKVQIMYENEEILLSGKTATFTSQVTDQETCLELDYDILRWEEKESSAIGIFKPNHEEAMNTDVKDCALKAKDDFKMKCKKCRANFVEDENFDKVFAMPSENWREWSDLWFCHNKDSNELIEKYQNDEISARKNCLLVDDMQFLIHEDDCVPDAICVSHPLDETSSIFEATCKGCHFSIGTINRSTKSITAFRCNVLWSSSSEGTFITQVYQGDELGTTDDHNVTDENLHTQTLESAFINSLIMKSRDDTCYRFWVRDPHGKPYIQIWLLGRENEVASSFQESKKEEASEQEGPLDRKCRAFKLQSVVKILFVAYEPKIDVVDEKTFSKEITRKYGSHWTPDALSNKTVIFPTDWCHSIISTLKENSAKILPSSARTIHGFTNSFLPK